MKVLDKCFLNTPKTIPIHYQGTWWVPLKTPKTIRIYYEGTWRVPLKPTKNNSNLLWQYLISACETHQKQFQYIMNVLDQWLLNMPKTIPIDSKDTR